MEGEAEGDAEGEAAGEAEMVVVEEMDREVEEGDITQLEEIVDTTEAVIAMDTEVDLIEVETEDTRIMTTITIITIIQRTEIDMDLAEAADVGLIQLLRSTSMCESLQSVSLVFFSVLVHEARGYHLAVCSVSSGFIQLNR